VIYYLKNDEVNQAYKLVKDMEPVVPKEYIIKAVVHAIVGA
jgi:intraflagellar transport protein 56